MTARVINKEKVLESVPVDPTLLNSANWWFGVSWYGILLAGATTALGALLTVAFLFVQYWSSGVRERQSDWRTSVLETQTKQANSELVRLKTPRDLTQEQRGRIVDKLKQFSGTEYDITVSGIDPEILSFVFTIEVVLSTAGWTELDWKGIGEEYVRPGGQPIIRIGASVTDVAVGTLADQPPRLFESALALANALLAEGVPVTANRFIGHASSSTNANAVHILIGRKT